MSLVTSWPYEELIEKDIIQTIWQLTIALLDVSVHNQVMNLKDFLLTVARGEVHKSVGLQILTSNAI